MFLRLFLAALFLLPLTVFAGFVPQTDETGMPLKRAGSAGTVHSVSTSSTTDKDTAKTGGARAGAPRKKSGKSSKMAQGPMDAALAIDITNITAEETTDRTAGIDGDIPLNTNGFMIDQRLPSHVKYTTTGSLSNANSISAATLGRVKAAEALKKKLQADNKKPFKLQDVANKQGREPREDILSNLMEASQNPTH